MEGSELTPVSFTHSIARDLIPLRPDPPRPLPRCCSYALFGNGVYKFIGEGFWVVGFVGFGGGGIQPVV